MKNIILAFALIITTSINAQRKIEKSVAVTNNQDVFLHFKFAQNIKIIQWNKNEVLAKAEVTIDDGEGNEAFSLQIEKSSGVVEIYSDFGDYFKNKNRKYRNNHNTTTDILYVVYVPSNVNLKIKSISGDVETDKFSGNLKTDLVSGDVTVKNYSGELWLKTVSGDLDVTIDKAVVNAKTLTGTIYSNLSIDQGNNNKKSSGYNKIRGTINNGKVLVKMETVSGNIYMRKS